MSIANTFGYISRGDHFWMAGKRAEKGLHPLFQKYSRMDRWQLSLCEFFKRLAESGRSHSGPIWITRLIDITSAGSVLTDIRPLGMSLPQKEGGGDDPHHGIFFEVHDAQGRGLLHGPGRIAVFIW